MRHRTYFNGGYDKGGITEQGGTVLGSVILSRDPEIPKEAATKRYVDESVVSLSASSFTKGTLHSNRMPDFTGDLTRTPDTDRLNLKTFDSVNGTHTRIELDNKGRVIGGGSLAINDIPDLDWDNIKANSPTTLDGYGIRDALAVSGGGFIGPLTITSEPEANEDLVTKKFVDSRLTSTARVGDIILFVGEETPPNYLQCNGGITLPEMFPELYAVIGESYNTELTPEGHFKLPHLTTDLKGAGYYIKY